MAKIKAEILCGHVYIAGTRYEQGDVVQIEKSDADIIKKADQEAGREFRLKLTQARKKVNQDATE